MADNLPNELMLEILNNVLKETKTCKKWNDFVPVVINDELTRNLKRKIRVAPFAKSTAHIYLFMSCNLLLYDEENRQILFVFENKPFKYNPSENLCTDFWLRIEDSFLCETYHKHNNDNNNDNNNNKNNIIINNITNNNNGDDDSNNYNHIINNFNNNINHFNNHNNNININNNINNNTEYYQEYGNEKTFLNLKYSEEGIYLITELKIDARRFFRKLDKELRLLKRRGLEFGKFQDRIEKNVN
ncbi:hypothetical protein Glove_421g70 [Diversispora epigaea]|uniref:Uncharacterized protein n=1 Tax=Diversispora epigaea TaxID=1348612 RepID=A0A397GWH9_9GLOM|nr:hypothetical protein Glove_421g70 [Diversispora epigaea]